MIFTDPETAAGMPDTMDLVQLQEARQRVAALLESKQEQFAEAQSSPFHTDRAVVQTVGHHIGALNLLNTQLGTIQNHGPAHGVEEIVSRWAAGER
ncbi:MAG: hypothetical protein JWN38_1162 [Candidatus Saccharibacteria bacterium]|nr:hypothetical protein [Candidatus Saccharibacteria bacterium]